MRILVFWDVYGRVWRKAFAQEFPKLKAKHNPDIVIVNIENITSWRGPVTEHAQFIEDFWVDMMTLWDHAYDNMPNINEYFEKEAAKIIRPANFYDSQNYSLPGVWYQIISKNGKNILIVQLIGEVFMSHKVQNPFLKIDEILESEQGKYDICIVDFHRETTAEIQAMAHYLSWRAELVYGTHTHAQTNDAFILHAKTAMISDVWMNGPHGGVIWAEFESVKKRFLSWIQRGKIEQRITKDFQINALLIEIDDVSNKPYKIEKISYIDRLV